MKLSDSQSQPIPAPGAESERLEERHTSVHRWLFEAAFFNTLKEARVKLARFAGASNMVRLTEWADAARVLRDEIRLEGRYSDLLEDEVEEFFNFACNNEELRYALASSDASLDWLNIAVGESTASFAEAQIPVPLLDELDEIIEKLDPTGAD